MLESHLDICQILHIVIWECLEVVDCAVFNDFCGFDVCRCPVKLFSKRPCVKQSDALSYAADLAVLMLHGKILDNLADKEHLLSSSLLMLYLKPKYKKIAICIFVLTSGKISGKI